MTLALHQAEVTQWWIVRVQSGDEQATRRLYTVLQRRFLPLALSFRKDIHEAQAAINDAFVKLQAELADDFNYQGERCFYSYFKTILQNVCRDRYREDEPRRRWEAEHLLPPAPTDEDDEDQPEYIERVTGYDPRTDETEMQRRERFHRELHDHIEAQLTPQDRRFWEAYRALVEAPGSHEWGTQKKTAFLKTHLGLPDNAFYIAHCRFRQKLEPFARRWGLVVEVG